MKYTVYFTGRKVGSIGIMQNFVRTVEANTEEELRQKLYIDFDHIDINHTSILSEENNNE